MDIDEDPWSDDEAVICIPFSSKNKDPEITASFSSYPSAHVTNDLPYGPQERYKIYSEAWAAVYTQLKEATRRTYAPVLAQVLEIIQSPQKGANVRNKWVQNLMPSRELPVALVVGDDKQEIFDEIGSEATERDELVLSILAPSHFTSLQVVLKAMIEGFIRNRDEKKRRTGSALAVQDMQLLCSWYTWLSTEEEGPRLVILVQDIEICNPSVVHDLLHICSNYVEKLPFTFVFGASSSDVMTTMFSRATRTLLSVKRVTMPNEHQMFEFVIQELFFSADTFPSLILSGSTLSWLHNSWGSYHGSLSALVSHLQLIYIRHFQNPLTILWKDSRKEPARDLQKLVRDPTVQNFLEALGKTLEHQGGSTENLFESITTQTARFQQVIVHAKYSFRILREVQAYLRELSTQQHAIEFSTSFVKLAEQFGDGKLSDICSRLLKRVRLLDRRQLHGLLERVTQISTQDSQTTAVATDCLASVERLRSEVAASTQTDEEARTKHPLSEDLAKVLDQLWDDMSSWKLLPLNRVWRTLDAELPIDILNPSLRSSVLTSLMHPGEYLLHDLNRYSIPTKPQKQKGKHKATTEPPVVDPDICVLFSRYINAGRTINAYDWFESFMQGIESTRPKKPVKGKGKGKAKEEKASATTDEEAWRREAYGRFMWAIHEMDILGLLRWTGRGTGKKGAECAGKVIWVAPDDS